MIYIYTRVSTDEQTTSNQVTPLLQRYPDAVVVEETASGAKMRPKLESLIDSLVEGDTLVVAALDRLGRSVVDVVGKLNKISDKKAILISIREGLDYTTTVGKFVANIMISIAEFERAIISERIKVALRAKRDNGIRLGRPVKEGKISRSTMYRRKQK